MPGGSCAIRLLKARIRLRARGREDENQRGRRLKLNYRALPIVFLARLALAAQAIVRCGLRCTAEPLAVAADVPSSVATPHPELPMPMHLSDEEMTVLRQLAEPIDQKQRSAFLAAVAAELEAAGQVGGPGLIHQTARRIQRQFWTPPSLPNASPRARA
jgi:hypothetical protein